ncbi:hypothetical protein ACQR36_21610 [Rhodococcus erythropolis]
MSTVQRNAGQAILITYTATSTADPVSGKSRQRGSRALRILAGRP